MGVTEYWQFDPRGEWIPEKLRGYRLQGDLEPAYAPIADNKSEPLQLQLVVEGKIISFYRLDNGVRLLPIEELNIAIEQETQRAEAEFQRAEQEAQRAEMEAQRAEVETQKVQELEAQIAMYQQRLREMPPS
jgi:regulator of protease activity HflC (stomatin/prohibitin superfamily)